MTEPENVAVPEATTAQLIELQRGVVQAQERFNLFLAGIMSGLGLDAEEWRISNDGRRFVKQVQPPEEGDDG